MVEPVVPTDWATLSTAEIAAILGALDAAGASGDARAVATVADTVQTAAADFLRVMRETVGRGRGDAAAAALGSAERAAGAAMEAGDLAGPVAAAITDIGNALSTAAASMPLLPLPASTRNAAAALYSAPLATVNPRLGYVPPTPVDLGGSDAGGTDVGPGTAVAATPGAGSAVVDPGGAPGLEPVPGVGPARPVSATDDASREGAPAAPSRIGGGADAPGPGGIDDLTGPAPDPGAGPGPDPGVGSPGGRADGPAVVPMAAVRGVAPGLTLGVTPAATPGTAGSPTRASTEALARNRGVVVPPVPASPVTPLRGATPSAIGPGAAPYAGAPVAGRGRDDRQGPAHYLVNRAAGEEILGEPVRVVPPVVGAADDAEDPDRA